MAGPAADALPGGRPDILSPAEGLCTRIKSETQRAPQEQVRANSKLKDHTGVEMRDKKGLARRLPLLSRRILSWLFLLKNHHYGDDEDNAHNDNRNDTCRAEAGILL